MSSTHGNVSGTCVIVLSSVDLTVFPNRLNSPGGHKSTLPAQYKVYYYSSYLHMHTYTHANRKNFSLTCTLHEQVKLGLISLVWRHSLDINIENLMYGRQKATGVDHRILPTYTTPVFVK